MQTSSPLSPTCVSSKSTGCSLFFIIIIYFAARDVGKEHASVSFVRLSLPPCSVPPGTSTALLAQGQWSWRHTGSALGTPGSSLTSTGTVWLHSLAARELGMVPAGSQASPCTQPCHDHPLFCMPRFRNERGMEGQAAAHGDRQGCSSVAQPPCAHMLLAVQRLFSCFPAPWAGSAPAQGVFVSVSTPASATIARDGFKAPSWGPGRSAWARAQDRHSKPRTTRHEFIPDTRRANTLQALPSAVALRSGATCPLRPCFLSTGEPSWGAAGCAPPPSTRTKQGTWTEWGAPGLHHEPVPCRSELGPDSTATHLCSKLGGATGQISPSLRSQLLR